VRVAKTKPPGIGPGGRFASFFGQTRPHRPLFAVVVVVVVVLGETGRIARLEYIHRRSDGQT
jgi:hypothetical protein